MKDKRNAPIILIRGAFILFFFYIGLLFTGEFFFSQDRNEPFITEALNHTIIGGFIGFLTACYMFYFGSADDPTDPNDKGRPQL